MGEDGACGGVDGVACLGGRLDFFFLRAVGGDMVQAAGPRVPGGEPPGPPAVAEAGGAFGDPDEDPHGAVLGPGLGEGGCCCCSILRS